MLRSRLFRDEALAQRSQPEPIDYPMRVTAPHEWLFLGLFAVGIVAVIAFVSLVPVERSLSRPGVLVLPGERYPVVSAVSGVVARTHVRPGDAVAAGQPVAALDPTSLGLRLRAAIRQLKIAEERGAEPEAIGAARSEVDRLEALVEAGSVLESPRSGEVAAVRRTAGQTVEPGTEVAEIRSGRSSVPEAVALIDRGAAAVVREGQGARVAVFAPERGAPVSVYPARVESVSSPSASRRGAVGDEDGPDGPPYLVRLSLKADGVELADGTPCEVTFVLEKRSPIRLVFASAVR